tara:strand:+ start:3065 stop:4933 length:1869 start_codon:yes stop_codon:yes gene_type:complete
MKLLLINTELYADFWGGYNPSKTIREVFVSEQYSVCPPLGILYIASYIRKHRKDIDIKVIDLRMELVKYHLDGQNGNKTVNDFMNDLVGSNVREFQPDLIGQSILFDASADTYADVSKIIRKQEKNIKIISGGFYPTNRYNFCLENDLTDYIGIGEGERPLFNFIENELDPTIKVKGILTKKQFEDNDYAAGFQPYKRELYYPPQAIEYDLIDDLDEIPWPAYDLVEEDMDYYLTHQIGRHNMGIEPDRAGILMTSRGCPRRCTFCATQSIHGYEFRKRSASDVLGEMFFLQEKYNLDSISFHDDTFTLDRNRAIEIFKKIVDEKPDLDLSFPVGVDVRTLNEEMIALFEKGRVTELHIAVESGNEYVQHSIIKKGLNLDNLKKNVRLLQKYNINTSAFFIIGFPDETVEMINNSKEFAKELGVDWIAVNTPVPIYGSEFYEEVVNKKLISEDYYAGKVYTQSYFETPNFTAEELNKLAYDFNIEVNFLYNINIRQGNYEKILPRYRDICTRFPTHIISWVCLYYIYGKQGDLENQQKAFKQIEEQYNHSETLDGVVESWSLGNGKLMFDRYCKHVYNLCPELEGVIGNQEEGNRGIATDFIQDDKMVVEEFTPAQTCNKKV